MRSPLQLVLSIALIVNAAHVQAVAVGEQPAARNRDLAADAMTPIGLGEIRVAGEIGRRLDITVNSNLLALDTENVFLVPFRQRNQASGYIGLGKLIDATVRFAAYTKDEKVRALKNRLVAIYEVASKTDLAQASIVMLTAAPPPRLCSRRSKSSGLPRYASTTGRGFPFTRRDSTMYQYLCPRDVLGCSDAMAQPPK